MAGLLNSSRGLDHAGSRLIPVRRRPSDQRPVVNRRRPEADAEQHVERRSEVATPVPLEDELDEIGLDVGAAEAVVGPSVNTVVTSTVFTATKSFSVAAV